MALTPQDRVVLNAWPLGSILSATTPPTGTINRTLLLTTTAGDYVLRAYRHAERWRVEAEHALIAYAAARGIPAPKPIPPPCGDTILERGGHFYALFPRAPGHQISGSGLDSGTAAAMGRFLAELHQVLRDFPSEHVSVRSIDVDPVATLAGIDRLLAVIRNRPVLDAVDRYALEGLESRRIWIERSTPVALPDLSSLGRQVIHGDYQEANLFFDAGKVSAIIDWDQAYTASRAWEVVRTLHLAFHLCPETCRAFLSAYRAELPLEPGDLEIAAAAYSLMRAHNPWVYNAYYLEGNDRVRGYIQPGSFVPFAEEWAAVSDALSTP